MGNMYAKLRILFICVLVFSLCIACAEEYYDYNIPMRVTEDSEATVKGRNMYVKVKQGDSYNAIGETEDQYIILVGNDECLVPRESMEKVLTEAELKARFDEGIKAMGSGDKETAYAIFMELKDAYPEAQNMLEQKPTPTPTPTPAAYQIYECFIAYCESSVSMRADPSKGAKTLVKLPIGTCVDAEGILTEEFTKVNYNGTSGYVLSQYLARREEMRLLPGTIAQVGRCEEYVTLRDVPRYAGKEIKRLKSGDSVEFLGESSDGFAYVRYKDKKGYVLMYYLE